MVTDCRGPLPLREGRAQSPRGVWRASVTCHHGLTAEETTVLSALPGHVSAIALRTGLSEAHVAEVLARLRGKGLAEDLRGGFYVASE